ncbi:MAG: PHP domain-containing protein [Chloroflexi bacterium]|nr:PHP domain-containing protein [Chloroflexota bacterium]MBL7062177.1 PHP domain-containing protein [Dehalococcoidia bacterium]
MIKADLHIHTAYSMDCTMSLEQIIARCLEVGINCLAVADHNAIAGALKMKEMAPFPIIASEEILTLDGEIIGMFLSQEIPSKLSAEETVAQIKDQGGLVCIPHPCDRLRFSVFRNQVFEDIMSEVDIIEVFNARSLFPGSSTRAWQMAQKYGKLASAGSDAHTLSEIGNACVEMPEFNGKDEFLASLAQGKISGNKSSPTVHFANTWVRLKKRLS